MDTPTLVNVALELDTWLAEYAQVYGLLEDKHAAPLISALHRVLTAFP